jgi:hypothetical protein
MQLVDLQLPLFMGTFVKINIYLCICYQSTWSCTFFFIIFGLDEVLDSFGIFGINCANMIWFSNFLPSVTKYSVI